MDKTLSHQHDWQARSIGVVRATGYTVSMTLRIAWWSIGSLLSAAISLMLVTIVILVLKPVSVWAYAATAVLLSVGGLVPAFIGAAFQALAVRRIQVIDRWAWFSVAAQSAVPALVLGTILGELVWSDIPGDAGMLAGMVIGLLTWGLIQGCLPAGLLHAVGVEKAWLYAVVTGAGALLLVGAYASLFELIGVGYSLLIGAFLFSASQAIMLEFLLRPIRRNLEAQCD